MRNLGWALQVDCRKCGHLKDFVEEIPPDAPEDATIVVALCHDCAEITGGQISRDQFIYYDAERNRLHG